MNVYQILIIILVVFILLYELVPSAQAEIREAFGKSRDRLHYLRAFIDDDDYDVVGHFSHNPFSMERYLTTRERLEWHQVRSRARRRQRQGWGSVHFDGPDISSPFQLWWRNGCLVQRRTQFRPESESAADVDRRRPNTPNPS